MGVNKKFLLLALLVVTSVSYSKTVTSNTGIWAAGKEGINKENEELIVTDGAIGINVKYENGKEGTGINNGIIKVSGNAKGIYINNISTSGKKNTGINNGSIEVSEKATGIFTNSEANLENSDKGNITVNGGTGILLNNVGAALTNNGKIEVSGSATGIELKGGTVENNKDLIINNGTGLKITGSNGIFNNNATGNIVVENGIGIVQSTGIFNNKTGSTITVNSGKGFEISGNSQTNNSGTITVNGGVGITQSSGTVTNKTGGIINITGGKGFYVTGGTVENSGTIDINSVTGLQLKGSSVKFENKNLIKVSSKEENGTIKGGIGVIVSEKRSDGKATFDNQGRIEVGFEAKGIQVGKGIVENNGTIILEGTKATGVYVNGDGIPKVGLDGKPLKDENGKIIMTGKYENPEFTNNNQVMANGVEAKAIHFGANGGTANNAGTIEVTSGGIGAYFGGNGTFTNKKGSNIIVSGKVVEIKDENGNETTTTASKGIFLNSKGTAMNEGNILVGYKIDDTGKVVLGEEGAVGVQVNDLNAKFTNNKGSNIEVAGGSQGIQVNKGTATNEGNILTEGTNAVGVYMNAAEQKDSKGNPKKDENGNILYEKAEFTNNNQIIASGTGAKGIQFGSGSGKVTNNKDIIAKDGAMGVFFYQGKNNILINSGTIDAGNGSAIESGKDTNNTVVLKNGSKIKGNIKGNTGVDVLAVEGGGEYKDLSITSYDKIVSLKNENSTDDAVISNSNISLEFNSGTKDYANDELNKDKTGLTIKDSNLVVDLTNKIEGSSLVDTGDGKLTLDGNMKIAFNGGNGEKEFNISEILGDEIVAKNAKFESSAMWDYTTENGDLIAKKKSYTEAVGKSQLKDFGKALEQSENGKIEDGDFKTGLTLLGLLDASQFTDAMTQLSGGVHGYTVDFAAINSRTLSNTIKNRELNKDRLRDKALNSYDQEVAYINNHHKIGGLMNVDYNEDGVLGITEKQIMSNGKLGLVYGGAKGKAKFENGKHGKANMDNLYLGGYYAYDFTDKLTLVSNANFVYSHTNVTRNIKFSKEGEESKLEQTYDSTYPVFGFGGGATLYYTPYDSPNNSVTLYGGIDWTKVVQGNINEDPDNAENKTNVTIKNTSADEQMYDSVVPHIGLSLSNNGYIFNRKYRLSVNVDYETELGNIKNGKKLKLSALSTPHRVETAERENIVSYSLNGALDLTEDFTIYGNYTKADSDEYDAERVEAGFKYKMDRMSDLFITGPLLGSIENSKPYSRRWTGVAGFILESEDDSDRSYYNNIDKDSNQSHSRGDYATSLKLKPKFTLSLNDRDTKWSYYFETYYMSNGMGMDLDKNERRKSESRIHAEARWTDQYSKGKYGFNIGYRNETTSSPTLSQYVGADRLTRGLHQFRFTPNFTYNLGNGFVFGGSTTGIIAYDYEGYRKGQTDFELENEYGITYNGLMPRWRFNVNYFREETWYDKDFRKPSRVSIKNGDKTEYVYQDIEGESRYQSNQLRPRITYFFGNGGRVELSARIPLGNGYWYNSDDHNKKAAEKYETRYGLKYYQPIAPGLTGMIGGEILTTKTKSTSGNNYGKETRDYSIRPAIGISYNF
jgi:putative surface-exposed virulence protein